MDKKEGLWPLSITIFPSLTEETRQGSIAEPLSQLLTINSHFMIFIKDLIKVALFWVAYDTFCKAIQKNISTDKLKYSISEFDISKMSIFRNGKFRNRTQITDI